MSLIAASNKKELRLIAVNGSYAGIDKNHMKVLEKILSKHVEFISSN